MFHLIWRSVSMYHVGWGTLHWYWASSEAQKMKRLKTHSLSDLQNGSSKGMVNEQKQRAARAVNIPNISNIPLTSLTPSKGLQLLYTADKEMKVVLVILLNFNWQSSQLCNISLVRIWYKCFSVQIMTEKHKRNREFVGGEDCSNFTTKKNRCKQMNSFAIKKKEEEGGEKRREVTMTCVLITKNPTILKQLEVEMEGWLCFSPSHFFAKDSYFHLKSNNWRVISTKKCILHDFSKYSN